MKSTALFGAISLSAFMLLTSLTFAYADDTVTPYGDYCRDCAAYGACKDIISPLEAIHAINRYYRNRGYRVGLLSHKGRFIEAEIYKNGRYVDKVLFDRKTGRLRSIY